MESAVSCHVRGKICVCAGFFCFPHECQHGVRHLGSINYIKILTLLLGESVDPVSDLTCKKGEKRELDLFVIIADLS